ALGQRRLADADEAVKSALGMAVVFMALCGLLFGIAGGSVAALFSADAPVIAITRRLLLVAAVFQVLDAVSIVLKCALRGATDVRFVMIVGALAVWSFMPTSAYVFGKLAGLGALGGWLGFIAETTVVAAFLWRRWKRGSWRKHYELPDAS